METHRPSIAIIHPSLKVGGGSEAVALWTIEALYKKYPVSLVTMEEPDISLLNEYYCTNIEKKRIDIRVVPFPYLLSRGPGSLKKYKLSIYCQDKLKDHDLLISSYNVMDFKRKGIQIIGDFSFDDELRRNLDSPPGGLKGIFYKKSPFRTLYLIISEFVSRSSKKGWQQNNTIANSNWSKKVLKDNYNLESVTIYPPVFGSYIKKKWEYREDGFIYLGRITPEKGIDRIISILSNVRKYDKKIHLHIFGNMEISSYANSIVKLYEKNRDWIYLDGPVYGITKMKILADHKYAVSGRWNEPFGIAIAELIKAGNIVWVPNGGGQVEIVNNQKLIYSSNQDAEHKIIEVLNSKNNQDKLLRHLKKQSKQFSSHRFKNEISRFVDDYLVTYSLR